MKRIMSARGGSAFGGKKILLVAATVLALVPMFAGAAIIIPPPSCPPSSPIVCILDISPNPISASTPTVVTVTALVTDPTFMAGYPGALNLLQTDANGSHATLLGAFADNGQNGDAVANDGILTIRVTVNQPSTIYLRATAAMKGKLLRVMSSVQSLVVQ
jgi:hypothetical protein